MKIAGQALFKNLNVRRELHGEDKALGIDLRFELHADAHALSEFGPELRTLLYAEGSQLRMPYLKPLQLITEYHDHTLHVADISFDGVTICKFVITAEPQGIISIAFNVAMSDADADCLAPLSALFIDQMCNVDIEPMQRTLDLVAGGKPAQPDLSLLVQTS